MDNELITVSNELCRAANMAASIYLGWKFEVDGVDITMSIMPTDLVRNAVKYISLDPVSRSVWDDPDMTPAHKYQNIPQNDLSTWGGDYVITRESKIQDLDEPIDIDGTGTIRVVYVYSATGEKFTTKFDLESDLGQKFVKMARIDKLAKFLETATTKGNECMRHRVPLFGCKDRTHCLIDQTPHYDISMNTLFELYKENPKKVYVPYRRGWSRLIEMHKVDPGEEAYGIKRYTTPMIMEYDGKEVAHLDMESAVTIWDGHSMKVENHGVKAEAMTVDSLEKIYPVYLDKSVNVRRLIGTHEYIQSVYFRPVKTPPNHYFLVCCVKGINVNGFEFDMP